MAGKNIALCLKFLFKQSAHDKVWSLGNGILEARKPIVMKRLFSGLFLGICLLTPPVYGQIDPYKSSRAFNGDLFDVKVYDSESKSYFEMKKGNIVGSYLQALTYAKSQSYRGVRGRLAVIRSKQTQEFINRTFRPFTETWIGLRLQCRSRKLVWVTGKIIARNKDYTNWGQRWHYPDSYLPCKSKGSGGDRFNNIFAGIGLVPFRGVIRWWAMAPGHAVRRAIVEYPTGKP
jgi:Lectin C-type domain